MKRYNFDQNASQSGDIIFEKSIEGSLKSATPGEWGVLKNIRTAGEYLCFFNPFRTDGRAVRLVSEYKSGMSAESYVETSIKKAIDFRERYLPGHAARLFFGSSDGIPGLVVDKFENVIVVQYHLLGAQKMGEIIKRVLAESFPEFAICESVKPEPGEELLAVNPQYPERIVIKEQEVEYTISKDRFQKTGFYYDHRANRIKLFEFFKKKNIRLSLVLDLYSYLGSWSIPFHCHLNSTVHCVDQADLASDFEDLFKRYGNEVGSEFIRSNVTKYLDALKDDSQYDLIICDPPAFKKGQDKKREALLGYEGLVKRIVPRLKKGSAFAFSSCTHGVDHKDLDQLVGKVALKSSKRLQLVDIGLQDVDHPMTGLGDKSMYIKYLLYICKE